MPTTRRPRKTVPSMIDKSALANAINKTIKDRDLTQTEAAYVLRDAPSQISLIAGGKLQGFSPERLIRMLTRFGYDVQIKTSKAKGKEGKVRVLTH